MANRVGALIKQARTDAGYTQEQLARKIRGISASDISKAERGELELTQAVLKEIARATGVTQTSLIEAAKHSTYKKGSSSSTSTSSVLQSSMKVSASEKELITLYRKADTETKRKVKKLLKGNDTADMIEDLLGNAIDLFSGK